MIKEDLENGKLTTCTGKVYKFSPNVYVKAVKFLMKKFDVKMYQAKGMINYFISNNFIWKKNKMVQQFDTNKRATNARLNNMVNLDYEWQELFK